MLGYPAVAVAADGEGLGRLGHKLLFKVQSDGQIVLLNANLFAFQL